MDKTSAQHPPNLAKIAEASGYSTATVSMALRAMARVPPATRKKIEVAAARLGYIRNERVAQAFQEVRRHRPLSPEVLAFISDVEIGSSGRGLWQEELYSAARGAARLLGYELEPVRVDRNPKAQRQVSRKLAARGVRGLLLAPITTWHPATLDFRWSQFAAIEIGTTLTGAKHHAVIRDYFLDCLELYAWLYKNGCRKIGFVFSRAREDYLREIPTAAWLLFQKRQRDVLAVSAPTFQTTLSREIFQRWVRKEKPDVILSYIEDYTDWIEEAGLRVPEDIALAFLHSDGKRQTGLIADTELMAKTAARLLVDRVQRGEFGLPRRPFSLGFRNVFCRGRTVRRHIQPAKPVR